jgi:hypothetical protein
MRQAVSARFDIRQVERVPYLYRAMAERTGRDAALLLQQEQRLIQERRIKPVGLRLVARRPPAS